MLKSLIRWMFGPRKLTFDEFNRRYPCPTSYVACERKHGRRWINR